MGRTPRPYTTYQRDDGTWYYSINWTSGVPRELCEQRKSSGIRTAKRKTDPPELVRFIQRRITELRSHRPDTEVTFGEYAEPFYTDRCPHRARVGRDRISPETLHNRRQILEKHIMSDPIWKARLEAITAGDIGACRERQFAKGLAKGSVKRIMDIVRTVLSEAEINRRIAYNPARAVPRLDRKPTEPRGIFTLEELRAMFSACPGPWGTPSAWLMFRIAAVTGMRSSEVRALAWDNVGAGKIVVEAAWKQSGRLGLPKWDIIRELPIPAFLQDEVERYGNRLSRWVVASITGEPLSSATWGARWRAALEALSIPTEDDRGRPRPPHSLRHSLRTHLASFGVTDSVAATFLGHELGLSEVDRGYLKLGPADMQSITQALSAMFGSGPAPGLRLIAPERPPTSEQPKASDA